MKNSVWTGEFFSLDESMSGEEQLIKFRKGSGSDDNDYLLEATLNSQALLYSTGLCSYFYFSMYQIGL